MNNDFLTKLSVGFSQAISVHQLEPCDTFGLSHPINDKYANLPRTENFPNPWHIGTMNYPPYPNPEELIQSELEAIVFVFGLVVQIKPELIVETGTNVGLMTRALGAACWVNGFGKVVSSDTDLLMVEYAKQLCEGLPVDIRHCPSLDLPELREADFVFIDSSYESRSQEHKLVKSGAVYVYHDSYAEPWIRPEMDYELFKIHLDSPRGMSIVRKA